MARRTKDEAKQTRSSIIDAAEDVFYLRGVSRTSMEEIAAAAGVTRGAIYWHFKDKMEICNEMAQRVFFPHEDMLEKLAAQSSSTPLEDLEKSCLHALKMMAKDKRRRKVVSILMLKCEYVEETLGIMKRNKECMQRLLFLSEKLFVRAQSLKMLSAEWTPKAAAVTAQALMSGLILGAVEQRKGFGLATDGVICIKSFFASLRADRA